MVFVLPGGELIYLPLITTLWAAWGFPCGQPAEMRCTSGAHVSAERSGAGWIEADVWMESAPDGRGFASVAINGDLAADNRYGSAAIAADIAPFEGMAGGFLLAQMPDYANGFRLGSVAQGWHRLRVEYDGRDLIRACVDGVCELARVVMGVWRYELVCVGVNPGESGHNPALCRFTNVRAG